MALNFNFPNNFYNLEWRVNGVWNQILTEAAQNSGHTYLNAPETRNRIPGDAYREEADLAMFQVVIAPPGGGNNNIDLHPVLQFEGKGGNSQYSWLKIRQQLFKWCVGYEADFQGTGQVDGVQRGHPIWCIGAKGDQVMFWLYSANVQQDHDLCMLPVEAINPINNVPLRIHDGTVNNLQNPPQGVGPMPWSTPAAIRIVQYMLQNPWAQGLTPLNPPNNFVPHPVGGQLGY